MSKLSAKSVQHASSTVILAVDVSRDRLNLFTRFAGRDHDLEFDNRTDKIETELRALAARARAAGAERILVVAESTGRYHCSLLRVAGQLGLETAWVSAESVAKMRVVETNDTGKTDLKDPHVIHTLASMGKTLRHRELEEPYSLLRLYNGLYDEAETGVVRARCTIHERLKALFPDFGFKKDFLFGRSGRALLECYGCNPYRIVKAGNKRFTTKMKKSFPTIRRTSIDRLYEQAEISVRLKLPPRQVKAMEVSLKQAWEDFDLHMSRKEHYKRLMEGLYRELRRQDDRLPAAQKGVITSFHLSRILAETGPLSDFSSWRQLLRLAGLNLRERQSGTYRGKSRISKKGRPLLRKILSQIVLPLVKRSSLYGPYYHHKRKEEKMAGSKAITAVCRRFVKLLFGWYNSADQFDKKRVFLCESRFKKSA
jgi:transposase